jgi:predicted CoA-binding protein
MNATPTVVLGATPRPDKFALRAMKMLQDYGHRAIPVNPAFDEVLGERCHRSISDVPGPIDTVTLYLRAARSEPLIEEILAAKPRRILFNPGTENDHLEQRAREAGIEAVHGCTLVMLQAGTY